jgi:hypothetical protein
MTTPGCGSKAEANSVDDDAIVEQLGDGCAELGDALADLEYDVADADSLAEYGEGLSDAYSDFGDVVGAVGEGKGSTAKDIDKLNGLLDDVDSSIEEMQAAVDDDELGMAAERVADIGALNAKIGKRLDRLGVEDCSLPELGSDDDIEQSADTTSPISLPADSVPDETTPDDTVVVSTNPATTVGAAEPDTTTSQQGSGGVAVVEPEDFTPPAGFTWAPFDPSLSVGALTAVGPEVTATLTEIMVGVLLDASGAERASVIVGTASSAMSDAWLDSACPGAEVQTVTGGKAVICPLESGSVIALTAENYGIRVASTDAGVNTAELLASLIEVNKL